MALANEVLARLSDSDLASLEPHLEAVDLSFRLSIEKPGKPIEYAVFPDHGIISVVANGLKSLEVEFLFNTFFIEFGDFAADIHIRWMWL